MIKQFKVNSSITAPEVRLLDAEGKQVGVMGRDEALDYALGQGADLVLIGEGAVPPVAKIIDFKKFLYQETKKENVAKKGQKNSGTKELRVGGPFAAEGDVEVRLRRAEAFLKDGFNVKIVVKFSGRQMAHPEFGHKIMNQFKERLSEVGKIDRDTRFEGKQLVATFGPVSKAKDTKEVK